MAKLSSFIKSLGYLDSAKKVHSLINELKMRNVKLTMELKARLVGKIQGKEALNCWRARYCEIGVPDLKKKENDNILITPSKQSHSKKRKGMTKKKSVLLNNGRKLDPNSINYDSEYLKAELKNKYKDYDYGLSDW